MGKNQVSPTWCNHQIETMFTAIQKTLDEQKQRLLVRDETSKPFRLR